MIASCRPVTKKHVSKFIVAAFTFLPLMIFTFSDRSAQGEQGSLSQDFDAGVYLDYGSGQATSAIFYLFLNEMPTYADVRAVNLVDGSWISLLWMFDLSIGPGGEIVGILPLDADALLNTLLNIGGTPYQINTIVTDAGGTTTSSAFNLIIEYGDEPMLFQQDPTFDKDTGAVVGNAMNLIAGSDTAFPPVDDEILILITGEPQIINEFGAVEAPVDDADCVVQAGARCSAAQYPVGSTVVTYPPVF